MKFEIVVLTDDWHGHPFSCKHLLSRFPADVQIHWVELIGLRAPNLSLYDLKRAASKLKDWFVPRPPQAALPTPANVHIVRPVQIPFLHVPLIRRLNLEILRRHARRIGPPPPGVPRVFVSTWPFVDNALGLFHENASVYYRVDDFSQFPGVRTDLIVELEQRLMTAATSVAASARTLVPAARPGHPSLYLPHGVEFDHFAQGQRTDAGVTPGARPQIGFFGLLDTWVDIETIAQTARLRPDLDFVFIGPSQIPEAALPVLPNLRFSGRVPYADLPRLTSGFDVGLIPFKLNELTLAVNPLKLLEYFAMGLPVVSSRLPEVERFASLVEFADSPESYAAAIDRALATRGGAAAQARIRAAQDNSWQSQADTLHRWMLALLQPAV